MPEFNHPINSLTPTTDASSAFSGMPLQTCIFTHGRYPGQLVHPPPLFARDAIESTIWGNSVKWIFTCTPVDFQSHLNLLEDPSSLIKNAPAEC
ncbi:hypothetical protein CEXT_69701 [Caerostris extrusa]|uniref:Uncharacterized protein n=1 Tax=Caerostris extrusa TaxID=172846 RepID=A0AAV4R3P8_CAEEX|nr:hypothetical protein CEXT_69701 [Caerostris extrusa]